MTNKEIATTILEQLGGRKFVVMTGSSQFIAFDNGLTMKLTKNISKANRMTVTLNEMDLYDIKFEKVVAPRMNKKDYTFSTGSTKMIAEFKDVYADQLRDIFTETTGMYCTLFGEY